MNNEQAEYLIRRYADTILRLGFTWPGGLDDAKDICQTVLDWETKLLGGSFFLGGAGDIEFIQLFLLHESRCALVAASSISLASA